MKNHIFNKRIREKVSHLIIVNPIGYFEPRYTWLFRIDLLLYPLKTTIQKKRGEENTESSSMKSFQEKLKLLGISSKAADLCQNRGEEEQFRIMNGSGESLLACVVPYNLIHFVVACYMLSIF